MPSYKEHFRTALDGLGETLHFSAHSHHLWPDVTREAQLACWQDGARMNDAKWGKIFGEVIPQAQAHIAATLSLPDPAQIVFAPNVHGFVVRLLSCLPADRPPRILTTDGEFHSFSRQARRLAEDGLIELDSVPCDPFDSLGERLHRAIADRRYDMIYLSQVFFDSGRGLPGLNDIVAVVEDGDTLVAIDGYHGFMALPTDLSAIADRVFYLAGGYKYAMSGEGCCFMAVPSGCERRPRNTGWFASFETLSEGTAPVGYADDGWRFAGATFDSVGVYRMNAVYGLLDRLDLTVAGIHRHVTQLQSRFLDQLDVPSSPVLSRSNLLGGPGHNHGHFLAFDLGSTDRACGLTTDLGRAGVLIDSRGPRVRFGFGLYHDPSDVDELARRLAPHLAGAPA